MAGVKYRVVFVQRDEHSKAFLEIVELLFYSLADLGYDVDVSPILSSSRTNIIIGSNQLDRAIPPGVDYIAYQFEQLSDESPWWKGRPLEIILRNAKEVWDYAPENIAFLKSKGIAAKHVILGYHEKLNRIKQMEKRIDILFYGSMNERRKKVLKECEAQGLRVQVVFGVYGNDRDMLIAQSRTVLNVHFYPQQIFEQARVAYLLNNGVDVVSEKSLRGNPWGAQLMEFEYESLTTACLLAAAESANRDVAAANLETFKRFPMTRILKDAL